MDPRLTKGLLVLAAVALYFGAAYVAPESAGFVREAAAMLFGMAGLRRPGDVEKA